jgi:O-antigen/teichoic acid export membrane protein
MAMDLWVPKNLGELKQHLRDPLFKNAYFLMANTLLSAIIGFFFWVLAARFYSPSEVGLGSALLSASGFLAMLSILGFDVGLIRFLPSEGDKSGLINSCFMIAASIALLLSIIFLFGLGIWSPALIILRDNFYFSVAFIVFTIFSLLSSLQASVFIAFRAAEYIFIRNFAIAFKIAVLPLLLALGAFGVYSAASLASILVFSFGIALTLRVYSTYKFFPVVRRNIVNDIMHYSLGNYVANLLGGLPSAILPLLVVNVLSAEMNAYFYIAWAVSSLLLVIPSATSTSLFAEGSFEFDRLKVNLTRALKFTFILLTLGIIALFLFGKYILLFLFGLEYINSFGVLLILALGSIPFAVNSLYVAIKRVEREIKSLILVLGGIAIITLMLSYMLIYSLGIIGVGVAWVVGNGVVASVVSLRRFK